MDWVAALSSCLHQQKKLVEAETLCRQVWKSRERRLGGNNRKTLKAAAYLLIILGEMDQTEAFWLCSPIL